MNIEAEGSVYYKTVSFTTEELIDLLELDNYSGKKQLEIYRVEFAGGNVKFHLRTKT